MKENEKLRLEEARENANSQEEKTTTEEGKKDQTEVAEEKEVNEPNSEEKKKEGEEGENEEKENSSTRKILIFSIVGVVAVALVIVLCIVSANSARKDKQEEVTNQQTAIEEEAEEQPTTIEEVVVEVEGKSTPEPTEEPTPEPTPEPTAEPVEMVSWEEWASQPGEEEPHLVVWNEEEGKQLIIEPGSTYNMEDGDKLAVSASLSKENLEKMTSVLVLKDGGDTKQNIVGTDYGQYIDIDIQKEGKNKVVFFFEDKEYGYIVVK